MHGNINIGESELEIMKVLWRAGEAVNTQYIMEEVRDKDWKRTTISTFLARLTEKGAILCEKSGKQYYYTPVISKSEYRKSQTKNLISSLYNGSFTDFALSLFNEQDISREELTELRKMFIDKED